ncbi:MAG: methylglyoxal synthase [Petrotoga sp.]|nr:methylglyoxal synthase [Petrotoga sp.]
MVNVALIAHDKKKLDLALFAKEWKDVFKNCKLYATKTTGKILKEKVGLEIQTFESGPLGGLATNLATAEAIVLEIQKKLNN